MSYLVINKTHGPLSFHDYPNHHTSNRTNPIAKMADTAPPAVGDSSSSSSKSRNLDQTLHLQGRDLTYAVIALNFANAVAWHDGLAITVMLATMGQDLAAERSIAWAGTAGLLGAAVGQMLIGYLSDSFGRRYMILASLFLMFFLTLGTGFIKTAAQLYILRGLTAITTGATSNLMNIAISDFMPLAKRPKYQGFQGVAVAIGSVIATVGGGALVTHYKEGWRYVFYGEAALAGAAFVLCYFFVPSMLGRPTKGDICTALKRIDYLGIGSLTTLLIAGLLVVAEGGKTLQWRSPGAIALMVTAFAAGAVFVSAGCRKGEIRHIVPFRMFKSASVTALQMQSLLFGYTFYAYSFFMPTYLQVARSYSGLETALVMLSYVLTNGLVAGVSGCVMRARFRGGLVGFHPILTTGFGLGTLGCGLFILCDRTIDIGYIVLFLFIFGIASGATSQNQISALQAHTESEDTAVVIGCRNMFRCVGGSVGCAVSGAVVSQMLRLRLPDDLDYVAKSTMVLSHMDSFTLLQKDTILNAFVFAIQVVFGIGTGTASVCFLSMWWVKKRSLEDHASNNKITDLEDSRRSESDDSQEMEAIHVPRIIVTAASMNSRISSETGPDPQRRDSAHGRQLHRPDTLEQRVEQMTLSSPTPAHLGWSEESRRAFSAQQQVRLKCSSHSRF